MPQYWLLKSEPSAYSFDDLRRDRTTVWDGVRNYQARNNLRSMRAGDLCLFYHSSIPEPHVAGICSVVREAFPDPTAPEGSGWVAVEVAYEADLPHPVTLARLRAEPRLRGMALLQRGSRLSVQPVTAREWETVIALARRSDDDARPGRRRRTNPR
jgi:predicted RNA-binding protein with PUA-like domain